MSWKKIGAVLCLIICTVFIFLNRDMLFTVPFSEQLLEDVVYVTKDTQENKYVLDAAGERLRKVDQDGVLLWEKTDFEGFIQEAERVVVNPDNSVFVHGIVKEEGCFRICSEYILEYSSEGEFIGVIAEYNYEEAIMSARIAGMFPTGEGVVYAYKQDNAFMLCDRNQSVVKSCPLENAGYIPSFAWDEETGIVYYCTFGGLVCKYIDGQNDVILYDAAALQELSVPKDISLDAEGNLYIADIGLRDVIKIDPEGVTERIIEEVDLFDKEVPYYLNADNGLIVCTDYSVKDYQEGEYQYILSCAMNTTQNAVCILLWIVLVVLALLLLILAIFACYYLLKSASKFMKMAVGMIIGVSGIAAIFAGILIPQFQNRILDAIISRAQMASEILEVNMPYDAFERIDSPADFLGEDYLAIKEAATQVFSADSENIQDLYCAFYKIQEGMIVGSYCLQEDTGAIYPYIWPYEGSDEQHIIETKEGNVYADIQTSEGSYLLVLNPVINDEGEVIGLLEVGADLNSFQKENAQMIMDLIINLFAITIVIILIAMEMIIFFHAKAKYDQEVKSQLQNIHIDVKNITIPIPTDILRLIVFAIFFLTNVATAFLPIYAMRLAETGGINSIPAEVMAALPISAEVVVGALFSILGTGMLRKLGEKRSVILSAIFFTVGFALRIFPNIWLLILGNAVIGAGWGLLLLIINTIIAMKPEREKDEGFASYNAAALNGVNCGVVFGGFLINWFSYQMIFILSTILSVTVYIVVSKYLTKYIAGQEEEEEDSEKTSMSTIKFLLKGKVLAFFVMIVIPIIACGYFLNYMYPILASNYGLQERDIGYSYLLNGLCVMCFGNLLTRVLGAKLKKSTSLILASVLYIISFVVVAYYQNIPSLMIAITLLGLSDSFGLPLQTSYYTDLKEVKQFGYDRAIGVYSLFENCAQAAGSFIFSYVLLIGVSKGLYLVVGVITAMSLLFLIISAIGNRKRKS